MFHTPPTKAEWSDLSSVGDSYAQSQDTDTTVLGSPSMINEEDHMASIQKNDESSAYNNNTASEKDQNKSTVLENGREFPNSQIESSGTFVTNEYLPEPLYKLIEDFFVYLKQPRFSKPLATFEIAELFQKLYVKFNHWNIDYMRRTEMKLPKRVRRRSSSGSVSVSPPIFEDEEEAKEKEKQECLTIQKYNAIAEEIVCEKFYGSIVYPNKGIKSDELELTLDREFNLKISLLNTLNVSFENLDLDLPLDEDFFICKIEDVILPEFEIMAAERAPTKKLKVLLRIHKLCNELVNSLTNGLYGNLNTDIYLPLLIYIIIRLEHVHTHGLTLQLNFIKRFRNYIIYEGDNLDSDEEKGQLLYVLTNFEAAIMYLASVTLTNLHIEVPFEEISSLFPDFMNTPDEIYKTLTVPLEMDLVHELDIANIHNTYKSRRRTKSGIGAAIAGSGSGGVSGVPFTLLSSAAADFSLYQANQGIRALSSTVDTSIRSIFGKVSQSGWIAADHSNEAGTADSSTEGKQSNTHESSISSETLRQITENLVIQEDLKRVNELSADVASSIDTDTAQIAIEQDQNREITPTSSNSTTETIQSGGPAISSISSAETDKRPAIASSGSLSTLASLSTSPSQDRIFTKMASSMGGVMKTFRPISTSSSSDSINKQTQSNGVSNTSSANRSRAASLINGGLFGNSNSHTTVPTNRGSFFNSIESAIEAVVQHDRSRNASQTDIQKHGCNTSVDSKIPATVASLDMNKTIEMIKTFPKFENRSFNDLTVSELADIFEKYQFIINNV